MPAMVVLFSIFACTYFLFIQSLDPIESLPQLNITRLISQILQRANQRVVLNSYNLSAETRFPSRLHRHCKTPFVFMTGENFRAGRLVSITDGEFLVQLKCVILALGITRLKGTVDDETDFVITFGLLETAGPVLLDVFDGLGVAHTEQVGKFRLV